MIGGSAMTESTQPERVTSTTGAAAPGAAQVEPDVTETVRQAVECGGDVREQVRSIVVELFRGSQGTGETVRSAVRSVYATAVDVVRRSAPENPDSVLRNVIDGITSGVQTVAQSAQYAIQEASARGQRFAGEDVDYAKRSLNTASDVLLDTVRYASERIGAELGSGARELKTHAERAVEAARPAIAASLDALARHPVQTATEAAGSTLRGGRLAAGAFLSAVSGVLAGAAELLDPDKGEKR